MSSISLYQYRYFQKREAAGRRAVRLVAARKLGTHTFEEWTILFWQCGIAYVRCGARGAQIQKDHIIPIVAGGSDAIGNIQPLCQRCNASKGGDWGDYRPANAAARGLVAIQGIAV